MCRTVMAAGWHARDRGTWGAARAWFTAWVDRTVSVSTRVTTSTLAGVAAGVLTGLSMGWTFAASIGFDIAALIFVVWTWVGVARMDAAQTALHATREDPTRRTTRPRRRVGRGQRWDEADAHDVGSGSRLPGVL